MIPPKEPLIYVGILSAQKIEFELYGDFQVAGFENRYGGRFIAEIENGIIVCRNDNHKLTSGDQIIFEPFDPVSESFLIKDVVIGADFHWERREKQRFIYSLKIIKDEDNLVAINVIPLERYLVSVISSEMSAKSSLELLKTQAVVARSWVMAQVFGGNEKVKQHEKAGTFIESEGEVIKWSNRTAHKLFDVCADDHCQRFQGVTKITSETAREAISQTRGIVLLSDEQICDTRYSKCCGGITEFFENVWEPVKHSYLSSHIDYKFEPENYNTDLSREINAQRWILGNPPAFCNTTDSTILSTFLIDYDRETKDFYRWTVEYEQDEISEIVNSKLGLDFGEIIDLIPGQRGGSGRLITLKIVGSKKAMTIGKELEIRRALSKTHLYSSAFIIEKGSEKIPAKFTIRGAGWGHGVGLCQIGAAIMAESGYMFDEILLHYYANVQLKRIYL